MYLRKHLETFGQVTLTLNRLLEECGYSTKSHNKSIYSDFREIIKTEIINKGYATCDIDIFTVNPSEYSTKTHNKTIYSDIREIIKTEIINKGYATCDVDIFTVNQTEMF